MIPAGFGIVRVSRRAWEQCLKRRQKMVPRLANRAV
jgi:aspartate aminotransferase-like enzyme